MPRTKEDDMDAVNPRERRTVIRNPTNTIEPVRLRLEDVEIIARVQDISITGIGLLIRQRLEPGTWLVLEPAEPSRYLPSELRAEVRHTRKFDEEDYLAGCRFSRLLTQEDVMALG
jgi:PilZ domain